MEELNGMIKKALEENINPSGQDIERNFLKFKINLAHSNNGEKGFKSFGYVNFKKAAVFSICGILCAATILTGSSGTVRAAAMSALDGIKSIFVVEGAGKDVKIVQKPAGEKLFTISEGYNTPKSDEELGKIIGYKIAYPETLAEGFELKCRTLHVELAKKLSYEDIPQIREQLGKAVSSQEEFSKLAEYSPFRLVSGSYAKGNTNIYIYALPERFSSPFDSSEKEEVEIGGIKGFWCKTVYPDYYHVQNDGSMEEDMSVEPIIKDTFLLYWVNNGIFYSLSSLIGDDLPKEEAVKIAAEFQAAQP